LAIENDTADWASEEFAQANLGDARLSPRLVALARQLAASPHTSLPTALSPAELKAAYRFFDNEQVDTDGVLAPHIAQTLRRMHQLPVVLHEKKSVKWLEGIAHLTLRYTPVRLRPPQARVRQLPELDVFAIPGLGGAVDRQPRWLSESPQRSAARRNRHLARLPRPARNHRDVPYLQFGIASQTCG